MAGCRITTVLILVGICGIVAEDISVSVEQVSGPVPPGGRAQFSAVNNLMVSRRGDGNITRATWSIGNTTLCTYFNGIVVTLDEMVKSCRLDVEAMKSYLEIEPTYCYHSDNITYSNTFTNNRTVEGALTVEIEQVLNPAISIPIAYKVVENAMWNFTFSCDVTDSTDDVINITLVTSDKFQTGSHLQKVKDDETCLRGATYTTNVSLPYGSCTTYRCDVYYDKTPVKGEERDYCNNITYPAAVALPVTSHLRTAENWTFTLQCTAADTQLKGAISLNSSHASGTHEHVKVDSKQDNHTKLWTNTLTADVTVFAGKNGSGNCDTYICNILYDNETDSVMGEPVEYCNNGTGVSLVQSPARSEVGSVAEVQATLSPERIPLDDEATAVVWKYEDQIIYTYNITSGENETSGSHGQHIKVFRTDPFLRNSMIALEVSACDIDTADISCELHTLNGQSGRSTTQIQINPITKAPIQMTPPLHKVVTEEPWTFTFQCDVTGVTENVSIALNTTSANHTSDMSKTNYNKTTCLYSATFTSTVTVAFNACSVYQCIANYPSLKTTKEGEHHQYCNTFTYPAPVAAPARSPPLRMTSDWTFTLTCATVKTSLNGSVTLHAINTRGHHSPPVQHNVYNKTTGMWTNGLSAHVTVPAAVNGTTQCDTYRCDVTYLNGNLTQHRQGEPQDYCNNGTGVMIAQSPDSVNISHVVELNASLVKLRDEDEAQVITWLYYDDIIYIYNKTSGENKTLGKHGRRIVHYQTDTDFKYSYISLNVSACDMGANISAQLESSIGEKGLYVISPTINAVLSAPVLTSTKDTKSNKDKSWKLTFTCDVTGVTEKPNLKLTGNVTIVTQKVTRDGDTCLWMEELVVERDLKSGECASVTCTAHYSSGNVTSSVTSYCNDVSSSLAGWKVTLIVVGSLIGVAAVVVIVGAIYRRRRRNREPDETERLINET